MVRISCCWGLGHICSHVAASSGQVAQLQGERAYWIRANKTSICGSYGATVCLG